MARELTTKAAHKSLTIRGGIASVAAALLLASTAISGAMTQLEQAGVAQAGSTAAIARTAEAVQKTASSLDQLVVALTALLAAGGGLASIVGRFRATQPVARKGGQIKKAASSALLLLLVLPLGCQTTLGALSNQMGKADLEETQGETITTETFYEDDGVTVDRVLETVQNGTKRVSRTDHIGPVFGQMWGATIGRGIDLAAGLFLPGASAPGQIPEVLRVQIEPALARSVVDSPQ